jgi:2-oxo-3-hexenedioate decarboxylase
LKRYDLNIIGSDGDLTLGTFEDIGEKLHHAAVEATPIDQLRNDNSLALADAYAIQDLVVSHRVSSGNLVRGVGLAFSSRAKVLQFGLSDQIYGCVTSDMEIPDGGILTLSKFIQPRVEPEISFILKNDISEPRPVYELMRCVEAIAVTLDVIDSRYENFKFSLTDVIADNSSHAAYTLGTWQPANFDLENLGILKVCPESSYWIAEFSEHEAN